MCRAAAHLAHDHHVLQLVKVEVRGPERHHEVAEADQGGVHVSKQADLHTVNIISAATLLSVCSSVCRAATRNNTTRTSSSTHHDVAVEDGHGGLLLVLRTVYNDNGNMM